MRYCAVIFLLLMSNLGLADDWPQWMGPQRDNVWREEGIIEEFPANGPRILWRAEVAGGYSGLAVMNGSVYVTDYVTADNVKVANFEREKFTGIERIQCLSEKTGRQKWKFEYPVEYSISYPAGPRCTPIVHDGLVYFLGAEGNLHCLRAASGELVWSKNFKTDFKTTAPLWGYAAHPLIDGKKLICVVGGEGSHAVAFNKDTGETIWSVLTSKEQGYSPPTIIEAAGKRQLILVRPDGISSVNPESGESYWTAPYEATNGSIIMSPVHMGDYLYVAGYSKKNLLLRLTTDAPGFEVVWRDLRKKAISPVNVQPMLDGGTLYGMGQDGDFFAIDVLSGDRIWTTPWPLGERRVRTGSAFMVRHQDRYFMFTESGDLVIAKLSTLGHQEIDRAHLLEPTNVAFGRSVVWSAPAFANKRVYLRNDKECICVDLAK